MTEYVTKDSGAREEYDSGMKRDTEAGKARFDLILPEGVPYEEQILTRFAMLLSRGAEKYDARNWEQGDSEAEIARAKSSAFRHFMQWITGETDEDHAVAVMFNLMVVETIRRKMQIAKDAYIAEEKEALATEWLGAYDVEYDVSKKLQDAINRAANNRELRGSGIVDFRMSSI